MNPVLEEIFRTRTVQDANGQSFPLESNTSREQCQFLQQLARGRVLEIGMAYGISTLALLEVAESLTAIDPFQEAAWKNVGLMNVERAGFTVRHISALSQDALPALLQSGERFDFAYVDTVKVFDAVLVDAWYITRLLSIGGIVAFDDCTWPGIKKLVRYLVRFPHLQICGTFGESRSSLARRVLNRVALPRLFRDEIIATDEQLGVAAECVAFRKIGEDERPWSWSVVP